MKKIYWNNDPNYKQLVIEKYGSPNYSFIKKGYDHSPVFAVTVKVIHKGHVKEFTAESGIKKEAEKLAAKGLLELESNEVLHEYSSLLDHTELDTELEDTFEKIVLSPNNDSTYGGVRVTEPKPVCLHHIKFVTESESNFILLVDTYSLPNFCKEMLVPKTDREIKLCMLEFNTSSKYLMCYYIGYYTCLNKYIIIASSAEIFNTLPCKTNIITTVNELILLIQ
jgi:hypothetical protein